MGDIRSMKNKYFVFEGIDCSGKTTAINETIKRLGKEDYIYVKGIGSNSLLGRLAKRIHHTSIFCLELVYNHLFKVRPIMKRGKCILQDRNIISITSYLSEYKRRKNRFIIKLAKRLTLAPDAIVYLHLPLNERINRLKSKNGYYESVLSKHPEIINAREIEYKRWYSQFDNPKISIDTGKNNISQTTEKITDFIKEVLKLQTT